MRIQNANIKTIAINEDVLKFEPTSFLRKQKDICEIPLQRYMLVCAQATLRNVITKNKTKKITK
jgi:hypothetical protein